MIPWVPIMTCDFFIALCFCAPVVSFLPCGDPYSGSIFFTPRSLHFLMWSFMAHVGPLCFLATFVYSWKLCATQVVFCTLWIFSLRTTVRPHGICCAPVVPPNTNSNTRILRTYLFAGMPFTFGHIGVWHTIWTFYNPYRRQNRSICACLTRMQLRTAARVMCHITPLVCSSSSCI